MVEVMNKMVTSFKISRAHTTTFSVPNPAAGPCKHMPWLEIPGHSRANLVQSLVGSLLLSPGAHKVLFVPSQSLFPQSCVSSEKAEEPEIKLPTSAVSLKKQESSRKTTISALLTMP